MQFMALEVNARGSSVRQEENAHGPSVRQEENPRGRSVSQENNVFSPSPLVTFLNGS